VAATEPNPAVIDIADLQNLGGGESYWSNDSLTLYYSAQFGSTLASYKFSAPYFLRNVFTNSSGIIISRNGRTSASQGTWVGEAGGLIFTGVSQQAPFYGKWKFNTGETLYAYFPSAGNTVLLDLARIPEGQA
jgi:hypothetical protein